VGNRESAPERQAEEVPASGARSAHITEMLAKINGEPGGPDSTKKPDTDTGLPEAESEPKAPEATESSELDSPRQLKPPEPGPVEVIPEDNLLRNNTPEYGETGGEDQLPVEQSLPDQVQPENDSQQSEAVNPVDDAVANDAASPTDIIAADWPELLPGLELSGVAFNLASNCILEKIEGNKCFLRLSEQHASLWNKNYEARIARAFSQYFDAAMEVEISLGEQDTETPARYQERIKQEKIASALVTIQEDENVKRLLEDFDGKLVLDSVRPI
jgi:DNA polymerase-3 subunit gamma/tau